ncbi:MAG: hypothetical protein LKM41_08355 [Lachnospiraceae bacterium]|jgi:hypothetical protein|nr:hypothetical protein [Lachnospiraceae bacterium]
MQNEIERLTNLVERATEDITGCDISTEGFSPELAPLAKAIGECLSNAREMYNFESAIADGDLSVPVPSRHNYFAGPEKDLYYKLKHLTWQAEEVAKGDYSQRVDFMGAFSNAFNFMITELEKREKQIQDHAEEKVRMAESQSVHLRKEMEIQMIHYQSYRNYVKSFIEFREHYKIMMGEVFELFKNGKYEEGRLLVAKINDQMASEVVISREYSNNELVDAAMIEMADSCRKRGISFSGMVYIPDGFSINAEDALGRVIDFSELVYSLMDIPGHEQRRISILSTQKNSWLSIVVRYHAERGFFPPDLADCVPEESRILIGRLKESAEKMQCLLNTNYNAAAHQIAIVLHICGK